MDNIAIYKKIDGVVDYDNPVYFNSSEDAHYFPVMIMSTSAGGAAPKAHIAIEYVANPDENFRLEAFIGSNSKAVASHSDTPWQGQCNAVASE